MVRYFEKQDGAWERYSRSEQADPCDPATVIVSDSDGAWLGMQVAEAEERIATLGPEWIER